MSETSVFAVSFAGLFLGILLVVVLAFYVMSRIFTRVSGWSRLAEPYEASHQPDGKTLTRQHMRIGVVRYRNCSTITIAPEGLYLAVAAPVIGKHPPLLIPWNAISGAKRVRLYWQRAVQLDIGRPAIASITVMEPVYDAMKQHVVARWLPQVNA